MRGDGVGSFSAQGSGRGREGHEGRWCWVPYSPLRGHEGTTVVVPTERTHGGSAGPSLGTPGEAATGPPGLLARAQPVALLCFGMLATARLKGKIRIQ